MYYGKKVCTTLKQVRKKIAEANDIPYEQTECSHQGDCLGTCPKCESELRYLNDQLAIRRASGRAISLVGLSLGVSALFGAIELAQAQVIRHDSIDVRIVPPMSDSIAVDGEYEEPNETLFGVIVEPEPEFPGGTQALIKFIAENIRYPKELAEACIHGRVTVSFVVEADGTLSELKEMRSPHPALTEEAFRIIRLMPKWKPGTHRGKPVRVKYMLPISFRLSESEGKK